MYEIDDIINKVHCADCLEFMKQMPDKCVDLVVTDPPYGLGKRMIDGRGFLKNRPFKNMAYQNDIIENDNLPPKECFEHLFRISKNQIIFGGNYFQLPASRGIICWDKEQPMKCFSAWEYIWTSFDFPAKILKYRHDNNRLHTNQKPIDLFKKLIANYSKESDIVFDGYLGSGTTAVACKQLGRNFIGIEIDSKYCKIAEQRLAQEMLI